MAMVAMASKMISREHNLAGVLKIFCDRFDRDSKLRQTGTVKEYIASFDTLIIHTEVLGDEFYLEFFISGLKEAIQAHVRMHHPPTWIDACNKAIKVERALATLSPRPNFIAKGCPAQA